MQGYRGNVAYSNVNTAPKRAEIYEMPPRPQKRRKPRSNIGSMVKILFMAVTAMAVLFAYLNTMTQIMELDSEITGLHEGIEKAESEKMSLDMKLEGMMSLKNVETYATETLGMKKVENYQTNYLKLNEGELLVKEEPSSGAENLISKLDEGLQKIMEYLR